MRRPWTVSPDTRVPLMAHHQGHIARAVPSSDDASIRAMNRGHTTILHAPAMARDGYGLTDEHVSPFRTVGV